MAVGTLLAFDCLLRRRELCGIRARDVALPRDHRLGAYNSRTVIALPNTKTGEHQSVIVDRPAVALLLAELVDCAASPDALLFPFHPQHWFGHFRQACVALGLGSDFVLHSLCHGGATHRYLVDGDSIEDVLTRGRWQSTSSARHYVQSGRAMLMAQEVPPSVHEAGLQAARDGVPSALRVVYRSWLARR